MGKNCKQDVRKPNMKYQNIKVEKMEKEKQFDWVIIRCVHQALARMHKEMKHIVLYWNRINCISLMGIVIACCAWTLQCFHSLLRYYYKSALLPLNVIVKGILNSNYDRAKSWTFYFLPSIAFFSFTYPVCEKYVCSMLNVSCTPFRAWNVFKYNIKRAAVCQWKSER